MYKKQKYKVTCSKDATHTFERVIDVDTDKKVENELVVFCPFCETQQKITVQGKVEPNDAILRGLKLK